MLFDKNSTRNFIVKKIRRLLYEKSRHTNVLIFLILVSLLFTFTIEFAQSRKL
jgi:hypothetical protein